MLTKRLLTNIFCKTGQGGGIDPTCKIGVGTSASLPKTAKDAGKDMASALATIDQKVASDPVFQEKIATNWAKQLRGKVVSTGDDFKQLTAAVAFNGQSAELAKTMAVHGRQAVVLVNDQSVSKRAESVGATALVYSHKIEALKHLSNPPKPGDATSESSGGAAAVLRHEYAHRVLEKMPAQAKEAWESKVRSVYTNTDDIKKELTFYAGERAAKSTSRDEVFTEAFTIGTSPHYDPTAYSERARSVIETALAASQTPKDA